MHDNWLYSCCAACSRFTALHSDMRCILRHSNTSSQCSFCFIVLGIPDGKPWLAVHATWGGEEKCHGKWRHGVCVYGISDLPVLIKHKALFANKFLLEFEPLAYECMEALIEQQSVCPPPFNDTYYINLPFIIK